MLGFQWLEKMSANGLQISMYPKIYTGILLMKSNTSFYTTFDQINDASISQIKYKCNVII